MVSNYSIRLKMKDKDVPQVSVTNIGAYTVETEGDFVTFGTFDKAVFDKWVASLQAAGVWHEARST
jgi:hypothetical protein